MFNFFDKQLPWITNIMTVLVIILIVCFIYLTGVHNTRQALCDQLGAVYVSTPQGNKCLVAKEIPLP
jgi:uncharacterized membrane protein